MIDITADQFETPIPYDEGIGCGFLTAKPSRRAKEIIRRVERLERLVERIKGEGFPEPDFVVYATVCGDSFSRAGWSLPGGVGLWVVPPIAGLPGMEGGSVELYIALSAMGQPIKFRAECGFPTAREIVCKSRNCLDPPNADPA